MYIKHKIAKQSVFIIYPVYYFAQLKVTLVNNAQIKMTKSYVN